MLTKTFFKLFPPPKLLNIPYVGLDVSDDALRCIYYESTSHGLVIKTFGSVALKEGIIEGGKINDPKALSAAVSDFTKKLGISIVKASLPEEKMYLFKTEIPPSLGEDEIRQNIEFKLEENVPLSAADAIFFYDLIPAAASRGKNLVSVSVAPLELVSSYLQVLKDAGLTVISFDITAKAIARALVPQGSSDTEIIIHFMNKKTGIYIVCGGVVCFTSTVGAFKDAKELQKEVDRVIKYWNEHGQGTSISRIVLSGKHALENGIVSQVSSDPKIPVEVGQVWRNAFFLNNYVPKISLEDSLDYAVSAGLALPS